MLGLMLSSERGSDVAEKHKPDEERRQPQWAAANISDSCASGRREKGGPFYTERGKKSWANEGESEVTA